MSWIPACMRKEGKGALAHASGKPSGTNCPACWPNISVEKKKLISSTNTEGSKTGASVVPAIGRFEQSLASIAYHMVLTLWRRHRTKNARTRRFSDAGEPPVNQFICLRLNT